MAGMLELLPTLTVEEVKAARKVTRVPPILPDEDLSEQLSKKYKQYKEDRKVKTSDYDILNYLAEYLPFIGWLRSYKWKQWLLYDVLAALAVVATVIPQGMSYAQNLAFLPQVYGIYGAFVPCLVYSLLGSSRHLSVGPVAVTSLLLGSGLTQIYGDFSINPSHPNDAFQAALQEKFNHGAIQISFIAGCFYTGIGVFRLGWIVNYLSAPVISGFMTGAASIIMSTQIKYITGQYYLPRSDTVIVSLQYVFDNMYLFRWPEFGIAVAFIFILLACQILGGHYRKLRWMRCIGPITVMIISLIIENAGQLYVINYNDPNTPILKDVGPVPQGMPAITASWWFPLYDTSAQLILAAVICVLDIAESTTIARRVAQEKRYKLNFTQELRALGFTNIFGSIFNCYTTTGAFSRTTINSLAGAETLLSSFVAGIFVMVVLLAITPVLTHLSVNVQGAIVIVAILPLFDFKAGWYYYDVNKLDFLCWLVTYLVVSLAGALIGIATGFGLSVALVMLKTGFTRVSSPGKYPGTDMYVDTELYAQARRPDEEGILIIRVESPMYFGNIANIRDHIENETEKRHKRGEDVKVILMDMEKVTDFDGATCYNLSYYIDELADDGISIVMANPAKCVVLALQRSALILKMRPDNIQLTMDEALGRARELVRMNGSDLSNAEKSA